MFDCLSGNKLCNLWADHVLGEINAEILRGASVAQSSEPKRLSPLRTWVRFSLRTHVKRVCQRSAESRRFSPGAPISSHRES